VENPASIPYFDCFDQMEGSEAGLRGGLLGPWIAGILDAAKIRVFLIRVNNDGTDVAARFGHAI
jgi:hypothetical protein